MPAMASGHGMVSGGAAFWASSAAAPVIAANVNSATVILACCMRFPLMRLALPSLTDSSLLETSEITRYGFAIGPADTRSSRFPPLSDPDGVSLKSEVHFSDDELPVAHSREAPP